ncbi:ABC transporter substrate-binding protein [Streptomyces aidingensis]|uniref:Multiple sugar transport system substrate-binding protein n=1 Tax=Streptomyces aidingensis TaxID=910347 RepID=A0A1I1MGA7_9ACTN|nr:extracellular solute-binding protein [Streptomyces aidingensis]SFC84504.1 multiple sugar transport system substrate-binding protein [Streptomyces aidingensis]
MSIRKAAIRGLAIAAVGSLALTACSDDSGNGDGGSGGDGGTVTLNMQWWGNDDRAARYEAAIDAFEAANPDIKVNTGFAAWPDYWTARNTEAAGGALPDVLQMDTSYLRQYAGTGQLADLTEYVGNGLDLSGFEESLVESGKVDGGLYAVATGTNTLALFYNPDLLAELGVEMPEDIGSWDEYTALYAEIAEAGADRDPAVYASADHTGTFWLFLQWLIQQDIDPFTEDGGLNFTKDDMAAWLETTAEVREAGDAFPIERVVQLEPVTPFSAVETATEFHWDNFLASYVGESGVETLELMPLPSGPDGAKHQFFKPTMQLAVGANSDHPEEAAKLIDFLVNSPEAGEIFGTNLGVPSTQAQRDALTLEEGSVDAKVMAYEAMVAEQGHVSEVAPLPIEGFGSIEEEYRTLHQEFAYGEMSVQDFVDRWFAEAEIHLGG